MKGSTLPRRLLAKALVRLRESAHITREAAAKHIEVGQQTLWRWETGQWTKPLKKLYLQALCDLYGASPDLTKMLLALTDEAHSLGWWQQYDDAVPENFDFYLGLEDSACALHSYQPILPPGLLQTTAYRRAMLEEILPDYPSEMAEKRIELTARRQRRLHDDGLTVRLLFSEAVLYNHIGNRHVMAEQFRNMVELGSLSNVSVRVVPRETRGHLGLITGPFTLLEFPEQRLKWMQEEPMVYVEQFAGDLYLGDDEMVGKYRDAYATISKAALTEEETRALILRTVEEYET